jgi:hypothetical protein
MGFESSNQYRLQENTDEEDRVPGFAVGDPQTLAKRRYMMAALCSETRTCPCYLNGETLCAYAKIMS